VGATARVASGIPYTPAVGLCVAADSETDDAGNVVWYFPQTDANGLYVWTPDLGGTENLNEARLPLFARVDLRATFRSSWAANRWQFYVEAINVLNRDNAGTLASVLEYDPAGDRPRLTYERQGGIPFLPSVGIRFQF
jgi:hypothetical protein